MSAAALQKSPQVPNLISMTLLGGGLGFSGCIDDEDKSTEHLPLVNAGEVDARVPGAQLLKRAPE